MHSSSKKGSVLCADADVAHVLREPNKSVSVTKDNRLQLTKFNACNNGPIHHTV